MDEPHSTGHIPEKQKRGPWPLWKKFAVAAVVLLVIIGLAVGLGVGLTQTNHHHSSEDDSDPGPEQTTNPGAGSSQNAWKPAVNASWQIILNNPIAPSALANIKPDVSIYDIDLFESPATTVRALQRAGKKVICYFSAGSYENFRPDKGEFHKDDLGKPLDGWPGERWLNVSSPNVRRIMRQRIELAVSKGCDAVDPDNVDGYENDNGLGLTEQDAVSFVEFLSSQAHAQNLSVGLKNAGDIIPSVLSQVDFSVNEQCVQYNECETFAPFVTAGKPVFHIEYPAGAPDVSSSKMKQSCANTGSGKGSAGFSTVIKKMDLDGWVMYCDGKTYDTPEADS